MLLRQVQARPLQGHHLRALRRRGHPPEGAPRAHGSHRLAAPVSHIWFFKGVPSRIGYLLDIAPRELERSSTSPPRSSRRSTTTSARPTSASCPRRSRPRSSSSPIDREEQFGEVEERLLRRREFFASGPRPTASTRTTSTGRARSPTWADDQGFPQLEEARELASGVLKDVARRHRGRGHAQGARARPLRPPCARIGSCRPP